MTQNSAKFIKPVIESIREQYTEQKTQMEAPLVHSSVDSVSYFPAWLCFYWPWSSRGRGRMLK